jgi:hypothetical protein
MFHTYVAIVCSKMFQLFQSYVASGFMFQVASVIFFFHVFHTHVARACSKCVIYFQTMLHSNVFFHVARVLCCLAKGEPGGQADSACGALGGSYRRGHQDGWMGAPGPGSRVPPREERGTGLENNRRAQIRGRSACVRWGEAGRGWGCGGLGRPARMSGDACPSIPGASHALFFCGTKGKLPISQALDVRFIHTHKERLQVD